MPRNTAFKHAGHHALTPNSACPLNGHGHHPIKYCADGKGLLSAIRSGGSDVVIDTMPPGPTMPNVLPEPLPSTFGPSPPSQAPESQGLPQPDQPPM